MHTLKKAQRFVFIDKVKIILSGARRLCPANRKKSGDCAWNPILVEAMTSFFHGHQPDLSWINTEVHTSSHPL